MTQIYNSEKYPIFLSNKPIGEDKFEGGAQQKTAENIINLIQQDYYSPKVIGIEGDWGAGKSNLIELIRSKIDKKYFTFIFDVWGNQEDLTRKSFLEQLVNQLIDENCLNNKLHIEHIKDDLLAKKSKKKNEKTPIIRPFWLVMILSLIIYGFLDSLYSNIFKDVDLISTVNFGIWKSVILIYFLPVILFLVSIFLIFKEYRNYKKLNSHKTFWDILSYITYWFQGKEIVTTESETYLEDEPSVYRFRDYFKRIEEEVSRSGRKLIIVFDNLDRLEKDKIKSLWSSIHTFFSETKDNLDSWVIIPYNKEELINHLNDDKSQETGIGFIEKSIPINFRITPPVVREWESYFSEKLLDAFGNIEINDDDKFLLLKIFDNYYTKTIKPRQIINFINSIVSLYLQREAEIKDGQIKIYHLAIFGLAKDIIVKEPVKEILSHKYLKEINSEKLFDFDTELDKVISALTFGVPLEMADEVLIFKGIKNIISGGNDDITLFSQHRAFKSYFHKAYYEVDIREKIDSVPKILNTIKSVFSYQENQDYWKNYTKELLTLEEEFDEFKENHKEILLKSEDVSMKENIIKKILDSCNFQVSNDDDNTESYYSKVLLEIEKFIEDNNLEIDILKFLKPIKFSAGSFIDFVDENPDDYKKYKISCPENEIVEFFENNSKEIVFEGMVNYTDTLKIIKQNENYKFEKLDKTAKETLESISWDDTENIKNCITILKALNEKPLKLKLSESFYSILNQSRLDENEIYIDAFCIAISNFDVSNSYINQLKILPEDRIDEISQRLEWYCSYGDLLKLIVTNRTAKTYDSFKKIAYNLTMNSYGPSRLLLDWALKNYADIISIVFDSNKEKEEAFIKKLSGWTSNLTTKPSEINKQFFVNFNKQENTLVKKIAEKSLEYFNNLNKDQYFVMMKNEEDIDFIIFKSLTDNNLVKSFSDEFYSAYDDFIKGISTEEINIPEFEFWDNLLNSLNGNKMKSYYTSLRDYFAEHDDMNEKEIYFFEAGLIKYGNLEKKKDDMSLKFILPMIKSVDSCFENVFLNNWEKLKNIITESQHSETIMGELRTIYKSGKFKDDSRMVKMSKEFEL
ncbi:P-loop NTPase fold protein [Chryseobacterium bernardetii]|uniref:P-loop NTPase fold protein n=1 Tax=Chryseobacterium bernardetii TaxID=1241978 RepID=UPI000F4EFF10|nr:P-loop NTPase fold protein [Chryseobacterium bernardetii]AZB33519.1 hypothetical protein EG351_07765 [Chryseobacterium bernardetii]